MRNWKPWLLLALAVWAGWWWLGSRPVARAAGVLAPDDPVQVDLEAPQPPIAFNDATLHPLARFSLTARVLSRDDYHFDAESDLPRPTSPSAGAACPTPRYCATSTSARADASTTGR